MLSVQLVNELLKVSKHGVELSFEFDSEVIDLFSRLVGVEVGAGTDARAS